MVLIYKRDHKQVIHDNDNDADVMDVATGNDK